MFEAAILGTSLLGGFLSNRAKSRAAVAGSKAQIEQYERGIAEQRRQFDLMRESLKPYMDSGESALLGQLDLLGLSGLDAQRTAIDELEMSPLFQAQVRQGEEALLQNASATGGLRGGNIQSALAQYRPNMLRGEIESQYAKLGGLSSMGQNAAAFVGNSGMQHATNLSNLYKDIGDSRARGLLAVGQAKADNFKLATSGFTNSLGMF